MHDLRPCWRGESGGEQTAGDDGDCQNGVGEEMHLEIGSKEVRMRRELSLARMGYRGKVMKVLFSNVQ